MQRNILVNQRFEVSMLFSKKYDDIHKALGALFAPLRGCRIVQVFGAHPSVRVSLEVGVDIGKLYSIKELEYYLDAGLFHLVGVQQNVRMLGVRTISLNGFGQGVEKFLHKTH